MGNLIRPPPNPCNLHDHDMEGNSVKSACHGRRIREQFRRLSRDLRRSGILYLLPATSTFPIGRLVLAPVNSFPFTPVKIVRVARLPLLPIHSVPTTTGISGDIVAAPDRPDSDRICRAPVTAQRPYACKPSMWMLWTSCTAFRLALDHFPFALPPC